MEAYWGVKKKGPKKYNILANANTVGNFSIC